MLPYDFQNKNIAAVCAVIVGALLVSLIIWLGTDINNKINESKNVMTVSGTSEVFARPDLAITVFSVVSEAKTVGEAMQDNTSKMNSVIASLKSQGIEEKDLKTTNFSISPRYEWSEEWRNRTLVGYDVSQSLEAKIRDMNKIGTIIEGATEAGANEVGNLQFMVENEDALKNEARGKAILEAKAKAKTLAEQLGVKLVKIVNFSESGVMPLLYYAASVKETPDIQTGENKISVTVSLTYQIR